MSQEVEIIVRGATGSGKSGLLGEIQILLQAMRIPHRFDDPEEWASEINLTGADWQGELERTKPSVVLKEEQLFTTDGLTMVKTYEDGKQAFLDGQLISSNPHVAKMSSSTATLVIQWLLGYNVALAEALHTLREKQT